MDSSKKPIIKTQRKFIALFLFLTISAILVSFSLKNSSSSPSTPSLSSPLHPFIKKACSQTLYTSLCLSTFSTHKNFTNFLDILSFTINRTANHVNNARMDIIAHFSDQDLNTQEKNAFQDCMQMMDQTTYELQQAMHELGPLRHPSTSSSSSYGNIKSLLSGAMTNENTCINGFLDLEEMDLNTQKGNGKHLQNLLGPISHMISNSLALIKHVEKKKRFQESIKKPKMMKMITRGQNGKLVRRRRKRKSATDLRPNVTVASDGSGKYRVIGDAIGMAPNMSKNTYVIKIKAGIYKENVMVPRERINIMLVGDGMNSTIITGSRNFIDGFSTFESADSDGQV